MAETADELLFSYGTLRLPAVQIHTFGRLLAADDDVLVGYTVDYVDIADPRVLGPSGLSTLPIMRATRNPLDKVVGEVLHATTDELEAADDYEVLSYRRISVVLASGRVAWAYVGR